MTPLRTRFIEDMQLHGHSPKPQSCQQVLLDNRIHVFSIHAGKLHTDRS